MESLLSLSLLAWASAVLLMGCSHGLKVDFYQHTCPTAEDVVSSVVANASASDSSLPPKLLRLLFHDCFVEGCDGSVLLDSGPPNGGNPEKKDPANLTLGGFGVIDDIKRILELMCPGLVSCADILVLAARDAVTQMGGPKVEIATGRLDGFLSDASKVRSNLPDTTFSLNQLDQFFSAKGLSELDIVTLSGAHTIGVAHCMAFNDRFAVLQNGSAEITDSSIDSSFAEKLLEQCPLTNPNRSTLIPNDPVTPAIFDHAYYDNLQRGRGLFHSDAALLLRKSTSSQVRGFAQSQSHFFAEWKNSFTKLSRVGVKVGSQGEIRKQCRKINIS